MKSDDILSVPDASALMGCSDVWVIKMIRSGGLEGFRLSGRAWAVSRKSVQKSIDEYQQRNPSRPGRKREGSQSKPHHAKPSSHLSEHQLPHQSKVIYLSMKGAAKRLGCGAATVRRAAKRCGIGILTEENRIVAVAEHELSILKTHIHDTSGNPNWIAASETGPYSGIKKTRRHKGK